MVFYCKYYYNICTFNSDNIYEVRRERDELKNEVKKLKENYQSKEFKYYVDQVKLQNMFVIFYNKNLIKNLLLYTYIF